MTATSLQRQTARVVGLLFLFGGVAVLANILWDFSFRMVLAGSAAILVIGLGAAFRQSPPPVRRMLASTIAVGAVAGLAATAAYDIAKWGLSRLDATPINPFEALPVFGSLVLGAGASETALIATGAGVHILNGITFGIAFSFVLGGRGIPAGIAWGLTLEIFQLTLYPGWLGIEAFREFATVSAGGHIVYGAVLGSVDQRLRVRRNQMMEVRT